MTLAAKSLYTCWSDLKLPVHSEGRSLEFTDAETEAVSESLGYGGRKANECEPRMKTKYGPSLMMCPGHMG